VTREKIKLHSEDAKKKEKIDLKKVYRICMINITEPKIKI
jgi:hypothetical protein